VNQMNNLALSMATEREGQGELNSGGKVLDLLKEMVVWRDRVDVPLKCTIAKVIE
jgi:hypothetical protein